MGITKTDFVRGTQCPKMLWLDHHKPEQKEIPLDVQDKLDRGNAFGDSLMGAGILSGHQAPGQGTYGCQDKRAACSRDEDYLRGCFYGWQRQLLCC